MLKVTQRVNDMIGTTGSSDSRACLEGSCPRWVLLSLAVWHVRSTGVGVGSHSHLHTKQMEKPTGCRLRDFHLKVTLALCLSSSSPVDIKMLGK